MGFMDQLRTATADIDRGQKAAIALHNSLRRATSWADLSIVLEQAQAAFEAGTIDHETTENLAALAALEAHTLPEVTPEPTTPDDEWTARIPADELVDA